MSVVNPQLGDAFGALCERGAARALETFAAMVGPDTTEQRTPRLLSTEELVRMPELAEAAAVVRLDVASDAFPFQLFCCFSERSTTVLLERLLGRPASLEQWSELEESAIGELANIQGCAFLEPVAELLAQPILPSPPATVLGPAGAVMRSSLPEPGLAAAVRLTGPVLDGWIVFVTAPQGEEALAKALLAKALATNGQSLS